MDWRLLVAFAIQLARTPSTWVRLGLIFTGAGFAIAPERWQLVAAIGMGCGSVLAFILDEFQKWRIRQIAGEGGFGVFLVGLLAAPATWSRVGQLFTAAGYAIAPDDWQLVTAVGL